MNIFASVPKLRFSDLEEACIVDTKAVWMKLAKNCVTAGLDRKVGIHGPKRVRWKKMARFLRTKSLWWGYRA